MRRLFFFLLLTSSLRAAAQDSVRMIRMTLPEALQIARKQQPDLMNAERNIAYAQAAAKDARSGYLPTLTAEVDVRYNPIIQTSVLPANAFNPSGDPKDLVPIRFGTPWTGISGLRLKQAIYDPSKLATINSSKVAENLALAQEKSLTAARDEEIIRAWYAILLVKAKMEYADMDEKRAAGNANLIEEQMVNGKALPNDLQDAKLRVRMAGIEKEKDALDLYSDRVYLSYMMGYDSLQLIDPVESLVSLPQAGDESWKQSPDIPSAMAARPDINEQKVNLDISSLELKQAKANRLPSVNLEGFLGANNYTNTFAPFGNWFGYSFIGLSLRFPIYGGGEKKAKIDETNIQLQQQQNNIRKLEQQAYYEILSARNDLQYQSRQLGIQQDRIRVQEDRIEIVRSRMLEGRALPQDLLEEEAKLSELQNSMYQYLHDFLVARVKLNRALGRPLM